MKNSLNDFSEHNPGKPGNNRLWLTWKLIRKQKLRTTAIFFGLVLSCFLLEAFGSFGYDFWDQVHEGSKEAAGYDRTQWILIALVTILLLLVAACSGILLHNLYSLTFARRWRSLTRLTALGAGPRDLIAITYLENSILYGASLPPVLLLTILSRKAVGIHSRPPFGLIGGILLWIWAVSCLCSILPLWAALRRPSGEFAPHKLPKRYGKVRVTHGNFPKHYRKPSASKSFASKGFARFMTERYRRANRGCHVRIILTVLAATLLYVPAGYLIETNISVQREGLDAKHGIQYDCNPRTKEELENALAECRRLADPASVIYVSMSARTSIEADILSKDLRDMLRTMGWQEKASFSTDGTLFFLEDTAYAHFLEYSGISPTSCAVLIDRYINRSSWSRDASPSYQELPLLAPRKEDSTSEPYGVEVYSRIQDRIPLSDNSYEAGNAFQWDKAKPISPDAHTEQIPEGISFGGDLSLILPLSRLEDFLSPHTNYSDLYVYGKFQDTDEAVYSRLEAILGADSLGHLRNTRKILQEWYASMSGIHRAMTAICSLLFSMATLNIFSMMLFQYMERKQGLAILWSLGLSPRQLLKVLTAMAIHRHLHDLEEPYKEVFMLRVFGELSFRKIGDIFGRTEGWARTTYHRAKVRLIDAMEKQ